MLPNQDDALSILEGQKQANLGKFEVKVKMAYRVCNTEHASVPAQNENRSPEDDLIFRDRQLAHHSRLLHIYTKLQFL